MTTVTASRPVITARPDLQALVADGALVGLTLGAIVGLSRLFTQPAGFIVPVAFVGITVHVSAWACRRARLELAPSAAIAVVVGVLTTAWAVLGFSTAYGIPWGGTLHAARLALDGAATVYRSSAAPVAVIPGFTLAGAIGAGCCAFLADWAAFRMRATTEACLPSFSLFILSAALAQGHSVVVAGVVWLAALLMFLLARQPAVESPSTAWFASQSRRGPRTVLVSGALLVLGATAAAAIVGPRLPGATVHPVINWRNHPGNGNRQIGTSPLVDITARLKTLSHREVFTVTAPRPMYWRLTSLDNFQGNGWALDNEYVKGTPKASSPQSSTPDAGPSSPLHAQFRLGPLDSIWLPVPYRPVRTTGLSGVSYSAEAGSLITNASKSNGLVYGVDSAVPSAPPALLRAAPAVDPGDRRLARYVQLPTTVPDVVRIIAARVTQGAVTEFDKARALQDWLRSPPFRYDLNVKPDGSQDALLNFLTVTRAGFCQQFAAAYAVLARAVGLPTRVAVGFTEGTLQPDGAYHVTDAEAHAWPEVYFPAVGWTAFEPTPTRGSPDPAAVAITGAPPGQAAEPTAPPPTAAPKPGADQPAGLGATTTVPPTATTVPPAPKKPHHTKPIWRSLLDVGYRFLFVWFSWLGFLVVAALAWIGLLALARSAIRTRRRTAARSPADVVDLAWAEASEALAFAGTPPHRWETPAEFATRAGRATMLPDEARRELAALARAVEVADYAPAGPDDGAARETAARAARVQTALRSIERWQEKARRLFDPRPVVALVSGEIGRRP